MNTKEKNVSKKRSLKKLSGIGLVILVILLAGLTGAYIHQNRKAHVITFYLVRHGQTYANVQGKMVGGDGESKLTAEGIQTSIATGKALKDVNFDSVYCSTLKRTQQTAKYILQGADKTGLTVQKEKGLLDIHLGNMEGLTPNEFLTKYQLTAIPDAFGGSRDASFVSPVGAETKYHFCQRFTKAMHEIAEENKTKDTVLVVAHSSMVYWLQDTFPDLANDSLVNDSVTKVEYQNGQWKLISINQSLVVK